MPPTAFKTNDMLFFHQMTVDTYKYATYGEVNPAIFQIVTFPFLFAVMYGDYGHGAVFFAMGAMLCLFEDRIRWMGGPLKGILVARYFILMMGFFACWNGLIYNEFFAVPNNWFGTCYDVHAYDIAKETGFQPQCGSKNDIQYKDCNTDCVYKFGMDPSYTLSASYLTFTNNIKEKLSVIIAYFHLNFGIILMMINLVHFGQF